MDVFRRVLAGDNARPSAATQNAIMEAARAFQQGQRNFQAEGPDADVVQIYIKAHSDLDQFAPISLGDHVGEISDVSQFQRTPVFNSADPQEAKPFAVAMSKCKSGRIGKAICFGLAVAKVYVWDEAHEFAGIDEDGDISSSDNGFARIIFKESGESLNWCLLALGSTSVPKPDSMDATRDQKSLEFIKTEETELSDPKDTSLLQLFGFDKDDQVGLGLVECLGVDPETGKVSMKDGEQYEILVRVKNDDGTVRALGYMPIGESSGEDPIGTGDLSADDCVHDTAPDGSGGGGGGGDGGSGVDDSQHETEHPGIAPEYDHTTREHPAKSGPCW